MNTFLEYTHFRELSASLGLLENFHPLNPESYDSLFVAELKRLAKRIESAEAKKELQAMENFRFTKYIAAAVRSSGVSDARELDEKTHEIVTQLLLGKLFSDYDPNNHGLFLARLKVSVANAVRNMAAKRIAQTRYTLVPILADELPSRRLPDDSNAIEDFRKLVVTHLGNFGLHIFDLRLNGEETKSLVGNVDLGKPTSYQLKQAVIGIKQLAKSFARQRGDEVFAKAVDRAMEGEKATMRRRFGVKAGR